jgi:hypothetical protein
MAEWCVELLNKARRLTLIKSVLTSIPLNTMAIFDLPGAMIERIQRLISDFFQGITNGRKATH